MSTKKCDHRKSYGRYYSGEQRTAWKNGKRVVYVDEHCDNCGAIVKRHVRREETK